MDSTLEEKKEKEDNSGATNQQKRFHLIFWLLKKLLL